MGSGVFQFFLISTDPHDEGRSGKSLSVLPYFNSGLSPYSSNLVNFQFFLISTSQKSDAERDVILFQFFLISTKKVFVFGFNDFNFQFFLISTAGGIGTGIGEAVFQFFLISTRFASFREVNAESFSSSLFQP